MMKKIYGKIIKKIFLFLLMVCLSLMSMATTYYVSNNGNDSYSGVTSTLPWKTLDKVNIATFNAGDQILFQRGNIFYGSLTIKQSGTPGNPITFGAYGTGSNPVITGFTTITAWTDLGNNIWESTNTVSNLAICNMVTINGINTAMGRLPKITDANKGYLTYQSHSGQTSITSKDLTGSPNWKGAEVVIRNQAFHLKRSFVTSQSASTINFGDIGEGFSDGNGFFFQNDIRCCTQQNDWYYNPSTNKIRMYSKGKPVNVNVSSIEKLITIQSSYLSFENITFTGANGCAFYAWDHNPRYNHVNITNCAFSLIGVSAIYTLIDYLLVSNNTISDCNITAVETSYGRHVEISNNTIQKIGLLPGMRNNQVYTMCNGAVDCGNVISWTVKNNSIRNIGFNGISFLASDTVLIQNNLVDTFCTVLDDGGAIYTYSALGSSCHAVKISGNICTNGISAVEGSAFIHNAPGIYLDLRSTNVEVCYNSIANVAGYGIHWTSAGNNKAHHNTVYNASQYLFYSTYYGGSAPIPKGDVIKNNIFVAKYSDNSSMDYQKCLTFYFSGSNTKSLVLASTTLDSNYYSRPIADNKVVFLNLPIWSDCFKTLDEWQTFSGQDVHSNKSFQTVANVDDLRFEYNDSKYPIIRDLGQPMVDVKGIIYSGSVTLQPYTSVVLMKISKPSEITSFKLPGQIGSSVINSSSKTIEIKMPYGTSIANSIASFTLSNGASVKIGNVQQASGVTTNSFVNPIVYAVTAQDGATTKEWTIQVAVLPNVREQIINLKSGWNTISFNVLPSNANFNSIFQPLIQSRVLEKIQDEKGNFMVNSADGWYSNLDTLDIRKGYNVKVNADAQISVIGQPISANSDIPLSTGFNIIGYPLIKTHEALSSFQNLINEGSLIKVQDETGQFIIKNGSTWFSGIDSLQPGKGYYVSVTQNTNMNFSSIKSKKIIGGNEMLQSATYFQKSFSGNPYSSMNFIIRNLSKNNLNLSSGDEIGIFDGNSCVGNYIYDGLNIIGLSAGMKDQSSLLSGFTPGDTIKFQIWKPSDQVLVKNITAIFLNNSPCVFASKGTAIVELQAQMPTMAPIIKQNILEITSYPNPFVDYTTFEFSLNEDTNVSLEIFDMMGKKVNQIVNQNFRPGSYTAMWNGTNQNGQKVNYGMYIYYFRAGNFISSKKIIFGNF